MIEIKKLKQKDIGRNIKYEQEFCKTEYGILTSWNDQYIFVKFRGPNGEACNPEDISFVFGEK